MELETAFYIIGIIFMSVMLILVVALVVTVFVIRSKIVAIHDKIDEKLQFFTNLTTVGKKIMKGAQTVTGKKT